MEESPSPPTRRRRFPVDDGVDLIDCSGKHCRSCTAGLVADCVAVCCCPCSVVSFLALALVKLPWMIGRRCLQRARKKRKLIRRKRECDGAAAASETGLGPAREEELPEIMPGSGEEEEEEEEVGNFSARFEAERIWLQLYQLGQLGFGRVSFTGNSNQWPNSN
ncbi:uncharacterized protein LOC111797691 [Cucurbita pepo subsp. pepo]|uniref:uncharacterized protein LOC111797691 n=1 Tax=Cucurbita pepo subsp. pepo TaxID=3664 RepID=UPI000C9D85F8|nr:uncharacterized protein LOC111797691 [Cucurbita pepo subsp. pepo]